MSEAMKSKTLVKKLDNLYEFDREPVHTNKLCRGMYFASSYAGEHIAATEFVIGALFVSWGATVFDIVVGLLIGNLLAVLSWTLICAPIATQTRLTLYWYLHKIGGPALAFIYNICNALLYCVLAGTMITVSASAVRLPFGIPAQTAWYPTDFRFVLVVICVGVGMTVLAILGFKKLAQFAAICSPWMVVIFIVGALVMMPLLGEHSGVGKVRNFSQFWEMTEKVVWTGQAAEGVNTSKLSFWHIVAFAWIANLAMHVGLSDMAMFRYARKTYYGLYTSTGMFLGHYLAWICAGILGAGVAVSMKTPLTQIDSGEVGYQAMGLSGALCVVISGWTTANPTLYKSGLAIQAVTPNWPRWLVTLVVGVFTTIVACFPFAFTQMLNFAGLYGLLLMPIGVVVFTEHWIFPKIGFTRFWTYHQKKILNWPALLSWVISIAVAMYLWASGTLHLFFLLVPVYLLTLVLYVVFSAIAGAKSTVQNRTDTHNVPSAEKPEPEKNIGIPTEKIKSAMTAHHWVSGGIAFAALTACLLMALKVFFSDARNYDSSMNFIRKWLIIPTLIYFIAGTYWRVLKEKE